MPNLKGDKGLVGQSAKGEWLGDALQAEHDKQEAEFRKLFPPIKGVTPMQAIPFRRPWTSIGQAPTEHNIEHSAYDASA